MRNERKLLQTLKISHAKQILFPEHESQFQITNDKDLVQGKVANDFS